MAFKDKLSNYCPFFKGGGKVAAEDLGVAAVITAKIADLGVTAAKLAANAVETAKIKDAAVIAAKLATDAVETVKIKALAVTGAKLAAGAVTAAKIDTAVVTGTTHGTPGTAVDVAHGITGTPVCFVSEGNAYISAVDATNVSVKSTVASQAFKVTAIKP